MFVPNECGRERVGESPARLRCCEATLDGGVMQVKTEVGALIQSWMDGQRYAPSWAKLATNLGVSRQTVRNWAIEMRSLPAAEHLRALAREIGQPYQAVLQAALRDTGYLTVEVMGNAQQPAPIAQPKGVVARTGRAAPPTPVGVKAGDRQDTRSP